jgi:energy-coupling factor transporter ATP-binding protein EcfA2
MGMHQGNPFSTRYVQPGALVYQFPAGASAELLLQRLREHGWWGQIVGPHGSGKTTLLHTLAAHLTLAERDTVWCTMKVGQRRVPSTVWRSRCTWGSHSLVIVDGYEQLGFLARTRLRRCCRKSRAGLLVTSHRSAGLPPLYAMHCSLETVQQLVQQLLRDHSDLGRHPGNCQDADFLPKTEVVARDDVIRTYQKWQGNVREVFFSLYDLYESRRQDR